MSDILTTNRPLPPSSGKVDVVVRGVTPGPVVVVRVSDVLPLRVRLQTYCSGREQREKKPVSQGTIGI